MYVLYIHIYIYVIHIHIYMLYIYMYTRLFTYVRVLGSAVVPLPFWGLGFRSKLAVTLVSIGLMGHLVHIIYRDV